MFSLNFRELWSPVSNWLTDELDQLAAAAQAKWYAQHADDGSHSAVTATSVTSASLSLEPYVYHVPEITNTNSATPGITLVLPRKTSVLVLRTPMPLVGPRWFGIHSIQMPGSQPGDVLFVARNTSTPTLIQSAGYPASGGIAPIYPLGNRIFLDTSRTITTTTDGINYFDELPSSCPGVTLVRVDAFDYESFTSGNRYPCWVQVG